MQRLTVLFAIFVVASSAAAADIPKARLLAMPRPVKTRVASSQHLAGTGIFLLHMDMKTGRVASIDIQKSTGQPLLDQCALTALRQWRAAPGAVPRQIRLPVVFSAYEDEAKF